MVALWPITCKPYSKKWIRILCSAVVLPFVLQLVAVVVGCIGGSVSLQFSTSLALSQSGGSPSLAGKGL
jgi:hypothetical protein